MKPLSGRWLLGVLALSVVATLGLSQAPVEQKKLVPADFVTKQEGQLPIILSAPHGGQMALPGVPARLGEGLVKGSSGFFTGRDVNTDTLAVALAKAIETRMGKKPYYAVAKFSRKYIDANRPTDIALESPAAKPVYELYHGALAQYCKEVQKSHGRGLLLDIHGQGTARDTIFRGTKDGKTVKLLVERYGMQAHNGPESLFGLMAARGCKVIPDPQEGGKERSGFTGGYIVQTYGSHQGYGIDAMQLEFGGDYRDKAKIDDTATKIADAVDAYARRYLFDRPEGTK